MKITIIITIAALALTGCSTLQGDLRKRLEGLPPGDYSIYHKNPYFDLDLTVKNGRLGPDGKLMVDELEYVRNGRFSQGRITITKPIVLEPLD